MPTFDLFLFGRSLVRFTIYAGLIAFVYTSAQVLIDIMDFLSIKYVSASESLGGAFTSSVPSCLSHMFYVLGLDSFITSFLSGIFGILSIWAGLRFQLVILQFSFLAKNLIAKSIG